MGVRRLRGEPIDPRPNLRNLLFLSLSCSHVRLVRSHVKQYPNHPVVRSPHLYGTVLQLTIYWVSRWLVMNRRPLLYYLGSTSLLVETSCEGEPNCFLFPLARRFRAARLSRQKDDQFLEGIAYRPLLANSGRPFLLPEAACADTRDDSSLPFGKREKAAAAVTSLST